jgi:hypothetical protein
MQNISTGERRLYESIEMQANQPEIFLFCALGSGYGSDHPWHVFAKAEPLPPPTTNTHFLNRRKEGRTRL